MQSPPLELFLEINFKNNFDGGFLLKSTMKVKAISWLAGGNPCGCNVGIYIRRWSRGESYGLVC